MRLRVIWLAAIPLAVLATEPIEFKGVPFGVSEAELLRIHPSLKCNTPSRPMLGDRYCTMRDSSYGGSKAIVSFSLVADKVAGATASFESREFEAVIQVLSGKVWRTEEHRARDRQEQAWSRIRERDRSLDPPRTRSHHHRQALLRIAR